MYIVQLILLALGSYLLASISSAIVVCKLYKLPDPRSQGSGNPGTTNVLRLGGKVPAAITLLGDVLKGFLPVIIAQLLFKDILISSGIYFIAFLGHVFPIYYSFKGGKGIATAIGGLFALSWMLGLGFVLIWILVAVLFRYSSLAALVAISCSPILGGFILSAQVMGALGIVAAIAVYRHKDNIQRLLAGKESKIGSKAKK
jgi:glycerol-3-phosphate acyltransferase PlsY